MAPPTKVYRPMTRNNYSLWSPEIGGSTRCDCERGVVDYPGDGGDILSRPCRNAACVARWQGSIGPRLSANERRGWYAQ